MTRIVVTVVCLASLGTASAADAAQAGTRNTERTALAIRYQEDKTTEVRIDGTPLAPRLRGKAKVKAERGSVEIEVEFDDDLPQAINQGSAYATYVMWAITPEGQAQNLGEMPWKNSPKLRTRLPIQRFALILTAEPYGSVGRPSPKVVAENRLKDGERVASAGSITYQGDDGLLYDGGGRELDAKTPVPIASARMSVVIAQRAGADTYARGELAQANEKLAQMEAAYKRKPKDEGAWGSFARETARLAHAARLNAGSRQAQVALVEERSAQAKALADAKSAANAAAEAARAERERATAERLAAERATAEQRAAIAEAERAKQAATQAQLQSLTAQQQALAAQQQSEQARQQAAAAQREAEQARAAQQIAFDQASAAMRRAEQATQERDALRQQLETSLNAILETTRSARGLVVNIGDVLFDLGQATLRPEARERLSRLTGVLIAYPAAYTMEFEGHTDSTGSDELNNRLSQARAEAVRDYMVNAGLRSDRVIGTRGFGKTMPAASNDTADGRQRNRRVEVVINDAQ